MKTPTPYKIGDEVRYVGRDSYAFLSIGDIVTVLNIGPGIFPPDVYVTVTSDPKAERTKFNTTTGYDWRFEPL